MKIRDIVRLIFALIFLLGAIANTYMGLFTLWVYETFADSSILPLYRKSSDCLEKGNV